MAFTSDFAEKLGTEVVDIYVGPKKKRYVVHKQLLTSQSDYFDKALNGGFREAQENSIYWEEDDPDAVALMVGFLYRRAFPDLEQHGSSATANISIDLTKFRPRTEFFPYYHTDPHSTQGMIDRFQHICFQPYCTKLSPEEIRLDDYHHGTRYGKEKPPARFWFGSTSLMNTTTQQPQPNATGNLGASQSLPVASTSLPQPSTPSHPTIAQIPPANPGSASSGGLFGSLNRSNPQSQSNGLFGRSQLQSSSQGGSLFGTVSTSSLGASHTPQRLFGNIPAGSLFAGLGTASISTLGATNTGQSISGNNTTGSGGSFGGLGTVSTSSPSTSNTGQCLFPNNPAGSGGLFRSLFPTSSSIPAPSASSMFGPRLPAEQSSAAAVAHRNALIHLLLIAEKICFPALFNAAIRSYILSGSRLSRSFPVEHAKFIYTRTSNSSNLRQMAMDYISRTAGLDRLTYMPLAQENDDFLADMFNLVPFGGIEGFGKSVVDILGSGTYDMAVPVQVAPLRARLGGS